MSYRRGIGVTRIMLLVLFVLVIVAVIIAINIIGNSTGTTVIK